MNSSVSDLRPSATQEVIELKGEKLALMNIAIQVFKSHGYGIYSGLVEKVVAIDDGVGVLVRWGPPK